MNNFFIVLPKWGISFLAPLPDFGGFVKSCIRTAVICNMLVVCNSVSSVYYNKQTERQDSNSIFKSKEIHICKSIQLMLRHNHSQSILWPMNELTKQLWRDWSSCVHARRSLLPRDCSTCLPSGLRGKKPYISLYMLIKINILHFLYTFIFSSHQSQFIHGVTLENNSSGRFRWRNSYLHLSFLPQES